MVDGTGPSLHGYDNVEATNREFVNRRPGQSGTILTPRSLIRIRYMTSAPDRGKRKRKCAYCECSTTNAPVRRRVLGTPFIRCGFALGFIDATPVGYGHGSAPILITIYPLRLSSHPHEEAEHYTTHQPTRAPRLRGTVSEESLASVCA